jgi:predicted kinase
MQTVRAEHPIIVTVPSLIMLIGPSGSGKSTFAARHFGRFEVVSSDRCRALITDSETDQSVTPEAFELLRFIARCRLTAGRLTVVDATNVHARARKPNLRLAKRCGVPAIAFVFDVTTSVCLNRNARRTGRIVDTEIVLEQRRDLVQAMPFLDFEGFDLVYRLDEDAIDTARVKRGNV